MCVVYVLAGLFSVISAGLSRVCVTLGAMGRGRGTDPRGLAVAAALALCGCSHEWDAYDPRLAGATTAASGAAGAGGLGGGSGGGGTSGAGGLGGWAGAGGAGGMAGVGGAGGAGSEEPVGCSADGMLALKDGFDDGAIAPVWGVYTGGAATVEEAGGALVVGLPSVDDSPMYGSLYAPTSHDLTGCAVATKVAEAPDLASNGFAHLHVDAGPDVIEIFQEGEGLYFKEVIGQQHIFLAQIPYSPAEHAYWRIREEGGTAYWETSADGQAWVVQASAEAPFPLTAISFGIAAGRYQPDLSPSGTARFESLNVIR